MATLIAFGRKPALRNDAGTGVLLQNAIRGSIYGSTPYHSWVVGFGIRAGKPSSGSANGWVQQALYKATTVLTDLVGATDGTVQVAAVMATTDRTGGADYRNLPTAPLMWQANQRYGIAARSDAGTLTFGQDNSGWVMHKRTGAAWPTPFAAVSNDPEGKMSQWVELIQNTAPKLPSNVFPTDGGYVTSGSPTIAADFRDDEEVLPGFALGEGDKLGKYHVRILNQAKTSVLKDSGVTVATGTMQTNRRATWAVPSTALAAGTYVAQVTLYDRFDAPSPVREWTFSVNAGGSLDVDIAAANIRNDSPLITLSSTPNLTATWEHDGGLDLVATYAQVRQQSTDTIVRGPALIAQTATDGQTFTTTTIFGDEGWASLPRGLWYRFEVQGIDSAIGNTPYTPSRWFRVDAIPNTATDLLPAVGVAVAAIPVLSGRFTDPDDDSSTILPVFNVRVSGDPGNGAAVPAVSYLGNGRWGATPTSAAVTGNGTWEWRAASVDPWGSSSFATAWQSFVKVDPPVIAITSPATPGEDFPTGTPTLTWTVDRTQSAYRVQLYSGLTTLAYDSGTVSSGAGSHPIPAATLRNDTNYTLFLSITTSDGLVSQVIRDFSINYVPLPAVTRMTAVMSAGDFEPAGQESEVTIAWDIITTEVSDEDWGGSWVRRTDLSTGIVDREWHLLTKQETALIDRTPRSGIAYDYTVTYQYRVNDLEWIESELATDQVQVVLVNGVLSDISPGGGSVPIRYWESRSVDNPLDVEVIPSWGAKPTVWQGLQDYQVIEVGYDLVNDGGGDYLVHSSRELVEALRAIKRVAIDTDGYPVPKSLCWRDPRGRIVYGSITSFSEDDPHALTRSTGRFVITENAMEV